MEDLPYQKLNQWGPEGPLPNKPHMSKTLTLKYPTVISKKYINQYQQYKDYTQAPSLPLVGCVYKGKTTSSNNVIGMLMEYGDTKSIIKDKHGVTFEVYSNTLESIQ